VPDEGDDRNQEKEMNQPSRDVKDGEAEQPSQDEDNA